MTGRAILGFRVPVIGLGSSAHGLLQALPKAIKSVSSP